MTPMREVAHTDPDIVGGTPVFVGTRVPANLLFDYLDAGGTLDEFLRQFRSVRRDQAIAGIELARDTMLARASSTLLGEELPRDLVPGLAGHEVVTVQGLGWPGLTNGARSVAPPGTSTRPSRWTAPSSFSHAWTDWRSAAASFTRARIAWRI